MGGLFKIQYCARCAGSVGTLPFASPCVVDVHDRGELTLRVSAEPLLIKELGAFADAAGEALSEPQATCMGVICSAAALEIGA